MDLGNDQNPDPFRDAIQEMVFRAVQVGSFAVTGVQVYAYHRRAQARLVAERDHQARRALNAQIRAECEADKARWQPALDPGWLRRASLIETAGAWGAALPYTDRAVPWYEPAAGTALARCEERLRTLHPYAMAWYDRLVGKGHGPGEAMRQAAPLFARHPQARDASSVPRPALAAAVPGSGGDRVADRSAPSVEARPARPCDEDFPLDIRDVLAAKAGTASAPTTGEPAPRAVVRPSVRGPRP